MKPMFSMLFPAVALALALGLASCAGPRTGGGATDSFAGPVGLQLYSLRDQFKQDVPGTLDKVRNFGVKHVELAGTYGLPPEAFRAMLEARGLTAVSGMFPYEQFDKDVEGVAREAKALGLQYAGCAWIPRRPFDEAASREAIAVFNRAGKALAGHGIRFFYHNHGYEFAPHDEGTLFDLMVRETDPRYVCFQMDVFWAAHPGQDPAALLRRYGSRWELMHLKDMKHGTPTGLLTGQSDVRNNVPMGTGTIDFPAVLGEAKKAGVKWYFIEDESPTVEQQLPVTIEYLRTVRF